MDSWTLLLEGFATALQPQYLAFAFLGVFVGTAVECSRASAPP